MENKTTVRDNFIDFYKGIGILLMIIAHFEFSYVLDKVILSFHMPLFFFLSRIFI